MDSKDLNDIVIEDNEISKKAQLKNILTLLALLFSILVISIVITELILGDDNESNESVSPPTANLITDTTVATNSSSDEKTEDEISSSSATKDEEESSIGTTAAIAGGAAALGTAAILASRGSSSKKDADKPEDRLRHSLVERNISRKVSLREHPPREIRAVERHATPKPRVRRTTHRERETHRETHVVKRRRVTPTKKPVVHTKKRVVHTKKTSSKTATTGYYIKVGTFKNTTNAINKVKSQHLSYRIKKIEGKDLTRVLVGPYSSRDEAKGDLAKVRAEISNSAYITKIK